MRTRRRGHGLEFEDLRSYASGDDIRHIDWKASARHNQLYTRLFREEKEQLVTLVLDFTSPMFTGSIELKAIQAAKTAAHLAWHLVSTGARCGSLIQTDTGFHAVRPAPGDTAALTICAHIVKHFDLAKHDAQPDANTANTVSHNKHLQNNITLFDQLKQSNRTTGAIILLAGLNKPDEVFLQKLKALRVAKQLVVLSIEDPLEYEPLPAGYYRYKSTNSRASVVLGKKQSVKLKTILEQQTHQTNHTFAQAQVPLLHSRIGITELKAALKSLGFIA